jgi:hypothetical protein
MAKHTAGLALLLGACTADMSALPACERGDAACVPHVVAEMTARYQPLADACDHGAPFSLTYLRTTETFGRTRDVLPYADPASVTREDALFADYFFRPWDAWHTGEGAVPPVWQVAFEAWEGHEVNVLGSVMLGMTAHIQRDLAFVLVDLAESGHPVSYDDHLVVNQFLAQVDVVGELADRFDPAFPDAIGASVLDPWRELAWNDAQRMLDAPDAAARAAVEAEIEAAAVDSAEAFRDLLRVADGGAARDAYCEARR